MKTGQNAPSCSAEIDINGTSICSIGVLQRHTEKSVGSLTVSSFVSNPISIHIEHALDLNMDAVKRSILPEDETQAPERVLGAV